MHYRKSLSAVIPIFGFLVGFMILGVEARAAEGTSRPVTPAADGDGRKPLEVKGQSRNLNMMLVLRNEKDKIKFVKMRENYREEILERDSRKTKKTTSQSDQEE